MKPRTRWLVGSTEIVDSIIQHLSASYGTTVNVQAHRPEGFEANLYAW